MNDTMTHTQNQEDLLISDKNISIDYIEIIKFFKEENQRIQKDYHDYQNTIIKILAILVSIISISFNFAIKGSEIYILIAIISFLGAIMKIIKISPEWTTPTISPLFTIKELDDMISENYNETNKYKNLFDKILFSLILLYFEIIIILFISNFIIQECLVTFLIILVVSIFFNKLLCSKI